MNFLKGIASVITLFVMAIIFDAMDNPFALVIVIGLIATVINLFIMVL